MTATPSAPAVSLQQGDRLFLRLLAMSPIERRAARWRWGTRGIADSVVERLVGSGRAERRGDRIHLRTQRGTA